MNRYLLWALITTGGTLLFGSLLPPVGPLFLIAAIVLWILYARSRPKRERPARSSPTAVRAGSKPTVVRVAFRDLAAPSPSRDPEDIDYGYSYTWALPVPPTIGARVLVTGSEGPAPAVVVGFGVGPSARGMQLLPVIRLATVAEIERASASRDAARAAWFDEARVAASLPRLGRAPRGYDAEEWPEIPRAKGTAGRDKADAYGRGWWRLYKQAEGAGRDLEEVQAFRSLAHRWFAIRDRSKQ